MIPTEEEIKASPKPQLLQHLYFIGYDQTMERMQKILHTNTREQEEIKARNRKRKARIVRVGSNALYYAPLREGDI